MFFQPQVSQDRRDLVLNALVQTRLPEALSIREQFELDGLIPDDLGDLETTDSALIHIAHNPQAFETARVLTREIGDLKRVLTAEEVLPTELFSLALKSPLDASRLDARRVRDLQATPQIHVIVQRPLAWFARLCFDVDKPLYRHFAEQGWTPAVYKSQLSLVCINNAVVANRLADHLFTP